MERDPFTEESLAEARARINKPLREFQPFNEVASKDAIRHFVDGYGDPNPLYRDEEYAKETKWGKLIAPPTFLYSCAVGFASTMGGIKGAHALWVGDEWEWFQPIHMDDQITGEFRMVELTEVKGQFASPMYQQSSVTTFKKQTGEIVATWKEKVWRFTRFPEKKRERYSEMVKHSYTTEEIAKIADDCEREQIRGGLPRYWEEVNAGDSLGQVVKGPLTITDYIMWMMGGGMGTHAFLQAHGLRLAYWKKHPTGVPLNEFGIPDTAIRVHWEDDFARTTGMPAAYDFGSQRITWMAQVVTNWMGDDGFLKKLNCQVRLPNAVTDTTWCCGKVTEKYIANGEHLVDVEVWGSNQGGQRNTLGWMTVSLPTKT